jgi:hypothetical protein
MGTGTSAFRVKGLRVYTIAGVAILLDVHRNTVRQWIKDGLRAITNCRPHLIRGEDLNRFLTERRQRRRRRSGPGEIYCVRCRETVRPDGGIADFTPLSAKTGNLTGLCPTCGGVIHRLVSIGRMKDAVGSLEVQFRPAKDE